MSRTALRIVLGLAGLLIMVLGLNVGLGGITTLGWQGPTDFATIASPDAYAIQDNHVRFLGGVWFALGLAMAAGALVLERLGGVIMMFCAMIFVGGVFRIVGDPGLVFGPELAPSLFAELVLFPLLALWIWRTAQSKS
ncbi:MAG: DUF4345 family protein [Pseudomonadota bacterium]